MLLGFYPIWFYTVRFLTSILFSSTFDSFSIWNSTEELKSCVFTTWYNSYKSISPGMATSDCENNAKFVFHIPKHQMSNLNDSILIVYSNTANFEFSLSANGNQLQIFNINFDFEDVQSNQFTSVRFNKSVILKFLCFRPSLITMMCQSNGRIE